MSKSRKMLVGSAKWYSSQLKAEGVEVSVGVLKAKLSTIRLSASNQPSESRKLGIVGAARSQKKLSSSIKRTHTGHRARTHMISQFA